MSKSHCLPMGAPMKRYMDPDLLLVRTNQSESPGMKRKRPIGDDDDESEDEAMLLASAKNQPFSRILNIASTAVPRKRGKDAKPVDQLDIKTGELLRRYARQSDVCESMKVAQIYISECCRGMRSDCVGFKWRFADDAPPEGALHLPPAADHESPVLMCWYREGRKGDGPVDTHGRAARHPQP